VATTKTYVCPRCKEPIYYAFEHNLQALVASHASECRYRRDSLSLTAKDILFLKGVGIDPEVQEL
jgi:hypothetical protein